MRYASLMMGVYFAATGLGNKVAGVIGEFSQGEPTKIELIASREDLTPFLNAQDSILVKGKNFEIETKIYPENGQFKAIDLNTNEPVLGLVKFENENGKNEIINLLKEENVTQENPYHAVFSFRNQDEKLSNQELDYSGIVIIDEVQTQMEFRTFIGITIFTVVFASIVLIMLKPLKRLTHGAEDDEREMPEQEQYDIAIEPKN